MRRKNRTSLKKFVQKIYTSPEHSASFTNPDKIRRILNKQYGYNLKREKILKALSELRAYTLHRKSTANFEKNPTIAQGPGFQWQMDITFFPDLEEKDALLLVAIDIVSKKIQAIPLSDKKATTVAEATERMLKKAEKDVPYKIQTDHGLEFRNRVFKALMKKYNIIHFMTRTNSKQKAAVVERVNRTIKEKLYRILDIQPDLEGKWHSLIKPLVASYNNTYHASIKMAPNEVTEANTGIVLNNLYGKYWKKDRGWKPQQFKVGDYVMISSERHPFAKAYRGTWNEEIFQIYKIRYALPHNMYLLKDWDGEEIVGAFYPAELQKVPVKNRSDKKFIIEKILATRTRNGKKEKLIRWLGYPPKFDSWEPADEIENIQPN